MKDTPTSNPGADEQLTFTDTTTDKAITKTTIAQQQNDENKNIIMLDDDNNQNILSTQHNENHNQTLSQTQSMPKNTAYIKDENSPARTLNDSDSNEMSASHTETPLPDWIAINESVLIRPYNLSGVISFIGTTHFSVITHSFFSNILYKNKFNILQISMVIYF